MDLLYLFLLIINNMLNIYMRHSLLIACVIFNINLTYGQQKEQFNFVNKALYQVTYLSDSLDHQSRKDQMTELLIADGRSLFRSSQKAYEDSVLMVYLTDNVITMTPPRAISLGEINAFNYQVVKDYITGNIKVYDEPTGGNLNNLKEIGYYFEPTDAMTDWSLEDDTLTINGHLCQRADIKFGGRKWTAWFSPELSAYPDGPYKFKGLPGLIFRVQDEKKTWSFELVELSKIDSVISINFKEGLSFFETTKQRVYQDRRDYQRNQIEIQELNGSNFGNSRANMKKMLDENIAKDNNWIELIIE